MAGKAWYEQDEFWRFMGPLLFDENRISAAPEEVELAVNLLDLRPGASVLDLCCGVGRHAVEFASRGFLVTGLDRTPEYLSKARERARDEGLSIDFIQGDMRIFHLSQTCDAVVNMFTSFGFFEDPGDDRKALACMLEALRPGGVMLMDTVGKEPLAADFCEKDWFEVDGAVVLRESFILDGWSKTRSRYIKLEGDSREEAEFTLRLYSGAELKALILDCGFEVVELFGNLAGAPYDHNADRLIAVAKKAHTP